MCGINGGWTEIQMTQQVIQESLDAMRHRGPDDCGVHHDGDVFIGNRRLWIIDREGGHQPIFNEDSSISVVLNGEIYNYRECIAALKARGHQFRASSDTEVLVHLYEDFGTGMVEHLRGMFAFAVWDSRHRTLFLARDRFGKKPLYYSQTLAGLIFASELKALHKLALSLGEKWAICDKAIYDYLSLGYIPQPETVYENVYALAPGCWMIYDGEDLQISRYWQLNYTPKSNTNYADALRRTRELIGESVRLRLRSDVPLGVFLSGGMDSSVIAYEAAQVLGASLETFTVAMEDAQYDESARAEATASHLGVRNTKLRLHVSPLEELEHLVWLYDQPYSDPSAIPTLAISRLAREYVKVVLNGDGGDELFAGYRRYMAVHYGRWLSFIPSWFKTRGTSVIERLPLANKRRSPMSLGLRFLKGLAFVGSERYLSWTSDLLRESDKKCVWRRESIRPTENWIHSIMEGNLCDLDTHMRADVLSELPSDLLVKMDMATMAASLEARSPFLDNVLAQFVATLPARYKIRMGRSKAVLRDAYVHALPAEVLRSGKFGFEPPLESWLNNELRPIVMDCLGPRSARVRSYICDAMVDRILSGSESRNRNRSALVYTTLMLELWLRRFG